MHEHANAISSLGIVFKTPNTSDNTFHQYCQFIKCGNRKQFLSRERHLVQLMDYIFQVHSYRLPSLKTAFEGDGALGSSPNKGMGKLDSSIFSPHFVLGYFKLKF